MRIPNLFIIGAPKCGTTALYSYLGKHSQVFFSPRKEPLYFCSDLTNAYAPTISAGEYLSLFAEARDERYVGEASVWYLYSRRAAVEIKAFSPDARIIVMLRNPVDMLYSLHAQLLYTTWEDIEDFGEALAAEADRKAGRRLPRGARVVEGLFYRDVARYAEQLERYFAVFGRERVHVIIYDDFSRDTERVYVDTVEFLGLDTAVHPDFSVVNQSKDVRNRALQDLVLTPPPFLRRAMKAMLPSGLYMPAARAVVRLNTRTRSRRRMEPELRRQLERDFTPEVDRLSELLNRDLSHWSRGSAFSDRDR